MSLSDNILASLFQLRRLLGCVAIRTHSLMMRVATQPASSSVLAYAQRLQACCVLR